MGCKQKCCVHDFREGNILKKRRVPASSSLTSSYFLEFRYDRSTSVSHLWTWGESCMPFTAIWDFLSLTSEPNPKYYTSMPWITTKSVFIVFMSKDLEWLPEDIHWCFLRCVLSWNFTLSRGKKCACKLPWSYNFAYNLVGRQNSRSP